MKITIEISESKLATRFSRLLREELGTEAMRQVVERNRSEKNPDVCHSHDFCDPNMTMHDAIMAEVDNVLFDGGAETVSGLWGKAWNLAKKSEF
jgi:hypothetical protein